MENSQTPAPAPAPTMTTEQMLQGSDFAKASSDEQAINNKMLLEIYENTRKTKNYMKWQLYITIVLVVLPLLAAIAIVPMVMSSLSSSYGGLLQ
jgi:hypothetical protein